MDDLIADKDGDHKHYYNATFCRDIASHTITTIGGCFFLSAKEFLEYKYNKYLRQNIVFYKKLSTGNGYVIILSIQI